MHTRRYTILANNCPKQHKVGMYIEPISTQFFEPKAFIESINFEKLFEGVEYWQSAQFSFTLSGVGIQFNNFIDQELDVIPNVYRDKKKLASQLLADINDWATFFHVKELLVKRMCISFKI